MRLFITSYQKSGTYQIMPAFGATKQIVGRAYVDMAAVKGYGMAGINEEGIAITCGELSSFKRRAFGHLPYLPEYAYSIQAQPTKVLFNVRDPRDIVVANYYNINKIYYKRPNAPGSKGLGHLNLRDEVTGELIVEKADPISALIEVESQRWPEWLGWLDEDFVMKVTYEELRINPTPLLCKVADFVRPYEMDVPRVCGNLQPQHGNPTFRAGRIGDWKTEFKPHHKKLAEKLLGGTIEKLGYKV